MKTGMVIVNYNDADTTIKLINNIRNYKVIDKIVIVDNNSTDDSLVKLESLNLKQLIVLETNENKGYSYALNIGAKYLIDLYKELKLIFSNADIIIDSEADLLELLNDLTETNVIVGPNILEDNTINRGWHIPKFKDDLIQDIPYFGKKHFKYSLKYDDSYYDKHLSKVETVSGSFFLMLSSHLKRINYFDEGVFLYYEENIFGMKTKALKKSIVIDNNVDVVHDHAKSINKSIKRINKIRIKHNSQYYFEKNYNRANIFELIILRIVAFISSVILSIKYFLD